MRNLSVYIHIPFCVRKCLYCDFLSFPATDEIKRTYVEALIKEIEGEAAKYDGYQVDTVFFGGGTPSLLETEQMTEIMDKLHSCFVFVKEPEITIEANPGTVDREKLEAYRKAGINRLSIGTQSIHDDELRRLGRIHSAADFFHTYEEARAAGFTNINVDIMSALPGQTVEAYEDVLRQIIALEPEHISAYSLIIEEGTPFYEMYGEDCPAENSCSLKDKLPTEDEERRMYELTEEVLSEKGYHRYEISNYAKEGKECRHNTAYWKRYDYVGFGIGAASMVRNVRWKNTSDRKEYCCLAGKGEIPKEEFSQLDREEQMEEFMFLGLRLTEGVSVKEFARIFGEPIEAVYGPWLQKLCSQGLLEVGERVLLTPYGRDISNFVMSEFILH